MKKLINFYKKLSFFQGAAAAVSLTSVIAVAANNIPGFFTFSPGTVISSSQINSNFDKLANLIEDNQSQVFHGTWDANLNIPDIFSVPPMVGGYYVVTTAGVQNTVAYAAGDWAIWNGTTWNKIQNISGVTSVFGRTGVILKNEGDYDINDLGDVNISPAPTNGQVLQFDGTTWGAGTLPTLSETDPMVMGFAKVALPVCSGAESLTSSGSTLICAPVFSSTPNSVVVTNGSGNLISSATISTTHLDYLNGVTSNIQTQLNDKATSASIIDWSTSGVPTIDPSRINLSIINRAVITDISGSPVTSNTTATELDYLAGATSNIQSQLNSKLNTSIPAPTIGSDAVNKIYADALVVHMKTENDFTAFGFSGSNYSGNTGINNSYFGVNAGDSNSSGSYNTYMGFESGKLMTTGAHNTAIGSLSLSSNGVKSFNTAVGSSALSAATTGSSNTAFGASALGTMTAGTNNTAVGKAAGSSVTVGSDNIFLGYAAGSGLTTGNANILIGNNAGSASGSNNIIIGHNGAPNLTGTNNVVIGGSLSSLTGVNDSIIFATAAPSAVERMRIDQSGNVGIGTTAPSYRLSVDGIIFSTSTVNGTSFVNVSDRRLKKNIVPISDALEKILGLRGVEFDWKKDGTHELGLIAQEVESVVPDLVVTHNTGLKAVKYANIVSLLIESTKDMNEKITSLENENKMLKAYLCAKDSAAPFCQ